MKDSSRINELESPQQENLAEIETAHDSDKEQTAQEESPLITILNDNIGDHREFSFGPIHGDYLPSIIIDNGIHFYPNTKAMLDEGKFIIEHHHVVRSSDHQAPALDLSITNMVFFQLVGLLLLFLAFFKTASAYKKRGDKAPNGFQNMIETIILFVRDDIVRPNVPGKMADKLLPYFLSLFFMILILNFIGLIPGAHTATSVLGVTAALATTSFLVIQGAAIKEIGLWGWLSHLTGGTTGILALIMIPIEILSMFIKPLALTMRLFANMAAGHMVLFSFIGLIFMFGTLAVAPVSVAFGLFIYLLETLVAFLQAFIFTLLTAIFVGMGIGEHAHDHDEVHASH